MEFEKFASIIAEVRGVDVEEITPDTLLVDDLGVDSLDMAEIIMAVEDELDISIDIENIGEITTVQDALDKIRESI